MFQENSSHLDHQNSHHSGSNQTNLSGQVNSTKSKPIRKEKFKQPRQDHHDYQIVLKSTLTKEKKKEMQKQKNRVAAQLSRDRQKKYVEDLQAKICLMEKQLQTQLCKRCHASLSDHSTTQQENEEVKNMIRFVDEPQSNQISFLNERPPVEQFQFIRDNSRVDVQWGNIGKYLFIFLAVLAISFMSSSVEMDGQIGAITQNRQVARVLTQNQVCSKQIRSIQKVNYQIKNVTFPSTIEQIQAQNFPFINGFSEPVVDECKNTFWHNYLDGVRKQINSPYDWNFVNCNNPNLVHISSVYENGIDPQNGKWTFLITNPTVTHSHIENTGKYYVDQVSYLDGVYQMIAQKVVLKKVMGKNCLA